jgi:hypothetical protein
LEAGFVGASGINLTDYNHNYNTAGIATSSNPINGITFTCSPFETVAPCSGSPAGNADLRVPYLGFQAGGLPGSAFDGRSNYNSLQVTVRKQFSRGFSMQGAYTCSKSLTNIFNATANSNFSRDLAQQYGPSNFNRPHRFILNYSWDLPLGQHEGVVGKLLEGWNLSGVTTIQDGPPLTFIDTRGGTAYGTSTTTIEGGYSRAQLCPGFSYNQVGSSGGIEQRLGGASGGPGYVNPNAICAAPAITPDGVVTTQAACPTCATLFGNSGVGILLGPGQFNFDASLLKTTRITERTSVQFRAEFFNLMNHPQFNSPAQGLLGAQGALPNLSTGSFQSPTGAWITALV